jgi:hypothetical protein
MFRRDRSAAYPIQPCGAIPANRITPASRLERKSRKAVAGSAPSTLEVCQPKRAPQVSQPASALRPSPAMRMAASAIGAAAA